MWFRIDDGMPEHPKFAVLPLGAKWLWVEAACWAARNLSDGYVPIEVWRRLGGRNWQRDVTLLRRVALLDASQNGDGYVLHDWADYQPSRETVLGLRTATANRQKALRHRRFTRDRNGVTNAVTNGVTNAVTNSERNAVTNGVTNGERNAVSHADPVPVGDGTANQSSSVADARSADDDDSNYSELIPPNYRAIDAAIAGEVRRLTATALGAEAVADIRADILGGRQVADPAAYAVRALRAEAEQDPRLGRWLAAPEPAPAPPAARRGPPSNRTAAAVLEHARHPEEHDAGRRADPDTAHRGAAEARRLLAEKARQAAAEKGSRPIADIQLPEADPLERIHLEPLEPGETEYDPADAEPEPEPNDEIPF
jgi:hypothetical protein